jgi:hypothetical protein
MIFSILVSSTALLLHVTDDDTFSLPYASAQSNTSDIQNFSINDLFENASKSLDQNNLEDSKKYLNLIRLNLDELRVNDSQTISNTRLLLDNAIRSLENNNIENSSSYLNLASKNLNAGNTGTINDNNAIDDIKSEAKEGLKLYENPFRQISMSYPRNWTIVEYPYNSISNNTIVGFISPSKTSSEMGNVSGVSGNFIPYLDLFEFDAKNKTLTVITQEILNQFKNNTNFAIDEHESITLKDNRTGYKIIYDVIIGREEHLKKIQVYTLINDKVYTLTFTAQRDLFENYIPLVNEIISSFGTIGDKSK